MCAVDDVPVKIVDAEVTCVRLVISELEEAYAINKIVTQKVKVDSLAVDSLIAST